MLVSVMMPVTLDAAENDPIRTGRAANSIRRRSRSRQVDVAVGILGDLDDVGDRFPPREFVGMVLVRSDEHHRALSSGGIDAVNPKRSSRPAGILKAKDGDESIDGAGRTRPGEDHGVLFAAADGMPDDRPGVLAESRGLKTRPRGLGMGVGVKRQARCCG